MPTTGGTAAVQNVVNVGSATGRWALVALLLSGMTFCYAQRGTLSVVEAAPQWKVIRSAEFGGVCYASPALVDGRICLRTGGGVSCWGAVRAAGK